MSWKVSRNNFFKPKQIKTSSFFFCRLLNCVDYHHKKREAIYATFNSSGTQLLSLRRHMPPTVYDTDDYEKQCLFYHPDCCIWTSDKIPCFAGDYDEFIFVGSDINRNIYMWEIPAERRSKLQL